MHIEFDPEEFERDMEDLENRLKILRAEYNQYFSGLLKTPPNFTPAYIRKIIKKYIMSKGMKGVHRFRYYNFVAKFNTMIEFYSRRIRDRNNKQGVFLHSKESSSYEQALKNIDFKPVQKYVVANVKHQKITVQSLFAEWNRISEQSNISAPDLKFDQFQQMVQKKTEKILKEKNCMAVKYSIFSDKGKIKIKAKAIRKPTET